MFVASGVIFLFVAVGVCIVSGFLISMCFLIASAGENFKISRKIAKGLMVITGVLVLGLLYLTFFGFSFFGQV